MIKESYCSYEVAMLLKEKGFDELCENIYFDKGLMDFVPDMFDDERYVKNSDFLDSYLVDATAPTHQMAMAWLREIHHICITIYPDKEKGFEAILYDIKSDVEITLQSFSVYGYHIFENSYEKAVETALKYCLKNLI